MNPNQQTTADYLDRVADEMMAHGVDRPALRVTVDVDLDCVLVIATDVDGNETEIPRQELPGRLASDRRAKAQAAIGAASRHPLVVAVISRPLCETCQSDLGANRHSCSECAEYSENLWN